MDPVWQRIDDPAVYVRTVLAAEAPDIPPALIAAHDWSQATVFLEHIQPDHAMLEQHDRDPVHIARRDGFIRRIRAGEPLPPLIVLGTHWKLVDGYARYRALRSIGGTEAQVLGQWPK